MPISKKDYLEEEKHLGETLDVIREKISELGQQLYEKEEKVLEFKKFMWDSRADMDPAEMKTMMSDSDLEIMLMTSRGKYLQKLFRIQNNPYFGGIVFESDEGIDNVYIGITHVEKNLNYLVHDWRSPIANLFYDYEKGKASYKAPMGIINGTILRKRQYVIKDGNLVHIFDNNINIDDELLQTVLAEESSDKMKNIVNTIQQEQNQVIRNTDNDNLIVQGIAGSGKTSVALHRIAFLLYKLDYLNSSSVLVFSPNNIFSEYISNVLPELGEENTMQTTYHLFLTNYLKEFKNVESMTSCIEKYYKKENINYDLMVYKQSDDVINDINKYLNNLVNNVKFNGDLVNRDYYISSDELNTMLKERYSHFPLFKRIEQIAIKICDRYYEGKLTKKNSLIKSLYEIVNIDKDYIKLYNDFFESEYSKIKEFRTIKDKNIINYEDATLFLYLKFFLEGVDYNTSIRQVVIDEAQDYTKMQYLVLSKIFRNANYTILGDINQTINPYYHYSSLSNLMDIFSISKYIELLKTYRSSEEIINYTNKILGLKHISAIRRGNNKEVLFRNDINHLFSDIDNLQKEYKSIAVITKTDDETNKIYNLLNKKIKITKIDSNTKTYSRDLVVIPSYIAKGLEFDAVIVYTDSDNMYTDNEKYLFYVSCTRAQHQLIVYNQGN